MRRQKHSVDFCVVGGGMAGMIAAIAAARHGTKVALIQDRPVLGGNASSEIRMHICGAKSLKETGILEEIELENFYRNPYGNYSIWDSILYEKVELEDNIKLFLNCSCNDLEMDGNRIKEVKCWQLTTETWHNIEAAIFADCTGDGILAPLAGAEYKIGREASREFNETIGKKEADKKTMGLSCLLQARETDSPKKFIPPKWAYTYKTDEELNRGHSLKTNFWWIELGGNQDSIHDTEKIRDELLKIAFGVWDHIKNQGSHGAENWTLDWIGFLPGKRESRRLIGDHILTQNDIENEGRFKDLVAYGGWPMDDHNPKGIYNADGGNINYPTPSPYGIPYRSLYSRNIKNLFFAGRNISATHAAMSSTRVMGTCSLMGQAIGTAAAMAIKKGLFPRDIYHKKIKELQQNLMNDDCFLPWHQRKIPVLTKKADLKSSTGNPEPLRNGIDRPFDNDKNKWSGDKGSWIEYKFEKPKIIKKLRFVFDSNLSRSIKNMPHSFPLNAEELKTPSTVIQKFRIEALDEKTGKWKGITQINNNYQRLVKIDVDVKTKAIRFIPEKTWGADKAHLFAWDIS